MADGSTFGPAFNKETMAAFLDEPEEELGTPEETPEPPPEPVEEPSLDEVASEEEAPEEPSPEEEPTEPLAVAEETPVEPEVSPEEPVEPLLLGRYKTPEDLANAYQELRGLQERVSQESHAKDEQIEEMKALLSQAAEALQGPKTPQAPDPQLIAWAEQNGIDPQSLPVLQQMADQAAQQRLAPMQEQLEAQKAEAERQAEYQQQVSSVQAFRTKHPEITPNSDEDNRHAEIFAALREDPQIKLQWNEETLEIAYEAAQDPDFYSIIRANPALIDTDEGLDYARWQATLKKGTTVAQTQVLKKQDQSKRDAAARKAHVETGGASPAGTPEEEDVVDIAFALQQNESPLFR